ncbi:hypothetical protein HJD18_02030 [Thermoleophilia bacterium SCSIO 60948]|nr:hypothetical protein HJD18_02030 [Thermoleophilia bacterium SCSIO 60948]
MKLASLLCAAVLAVLLATGIAVAAGSLTSSSKKVNLPPSSTQLEKRAADARCANGRFAVAGGFDTDFGTEGSDPRAFVESMRPRGRSWRGTGFNTGGSATELRVEAYCSKRRPQVVKFGSTRIAPQEKGAVLVRCPGGTTVRGLGYQTEARLGEGSSRVFLVVTEARRRNPRTVRVEAINIPGGAPNPERGTLEAYAVCGKGPRLDALRGSRTIETGETAALASVCDKGRRAGFGGFALRSETSGAPIPERQFLATRFSRSSERSWVVRSVNASRELTLRARTWAYCTR